MKSKPELDKMLQERLYEHSVAPPGFVWTNIEQELRRKRRRVVALWWFLGVGLTATGLFISSRQSAVSGQQSTVGSQQSVVSSQPSAVRSLEAQALSSQRSVGTQQSEGALSSQRSVGALSSQRSVGTQQSVGALSSQRSVGTLSSQHIKVTQHSEGALSSQQSEGTQHSEGALSSQQSEGTQQNEGVLSSQQSVGTQQSVGPLPLLEPELVGWKRPAPTYPRVKPIVRKKQDLKNCYDFEHMGTVWWLDAYAGPSITRRQFSAKDSEFDNYLAQRLETESPEMAFNAGIRANMLFRENFVLRSGFHYDQFVEKFEWADPNSIEVITRTRTQLINGVWETVIDTLSVEYGDNYIKTYNRFGVLDIPLELGIELRRGRTGVSINGGVSVNMLFWKRGAILSPDNNQPAYFTPDEGTLEVFKTNAGLSIIGSVQWFYHIRPTLRLFAEPYYRQVVKPITLNGHPVDQQYGIGGLKIGMTKILHGK